MLGLSRSGVMTLVAAIVCIVSVVAFALNYLVPAPPSTIAIATAFKGGFYERLGHEYAEVLGRSRVEADVLLTDGSIENLKLLRDQTPGAQVAIVQGGVSDGVHEPDVMSLGRVSYRTFGIFYRASEKLESLSQFKGKRIAVGPVASGERLVLVNVLALGGITAENATLSPLLKWMLFAAVGFGAVSLGVAS
jgi:TRAP-type uncharacterized transport system substrate-binding protein